MMPLSLCTAHEHEWLVVKAYLDVYPHSCSEVECQGKGNEFSLLCRNFNQQQVGKKGFRYTAESEGRDIWKQHLGDVCAS
jgi:hypothetical protein